jgi:hypothetical protein
MSGAFSWNYLWNNWEGNGSERDEIDELCDEYESDGDQSWMTESENDFEEIEVVEH